jgi:hypothetical protein
MERFYSGIDARAYFISGTGSADFSVDRERTAEM